MVKQFTLLNTIITFCLLDLNVLDWSKENQVAIALGNTVHIYSFSTSSTRELCQSAEQGVYPTSLQYNSDGKCIAVGTSDSEIQVYACLYSHLGFVDTCVVNTA